MTYTFKKVSYLLLVSVTILLTGCKSTTQKMKEFADSYNRYASSISNDMIKGTKAEITSANSIKIWIYTFIKSDDKTQQDLFKQMYGPLTKSMFNDNPKLTELINNDVTITFAICGSDNESFAEFEINKTKLNELRAQKTDRKDNLKESQTPSHGIMADALKIINEGLPIEDKTTGTKILKIDITPDNELTYTVEAPDDYTILLASNESREILRDEILRSSTIKATLKAIQQYGIKTVKYIYVDKQGKTMGEITTN